MYWDIGYLFVLLGAGISAFASFNVKHTFRKYSKVSNRIGITAENCAAAIMRGAGVCGVQIERITGTLTDHYSPSEKILRLSESVYGSTSVAALGVAAHECGHAIQHSVGYFPLKLRSLSVPVANIGSKLSWPVILVGLIFNQTGVAKVGAFLFGFVVLFQLITLPVEVNASRRARIILKESRFLNDDELKSATKVLRAAAYTYVASLFTSLLQLLRLILIVKRNSRNK